MTTFPFQITKIGIILCNSKYFPIFAEKSVDK